MLYNLVDQLENYINIIDLKTGYKNKGRHAIVLHPKLNLHCQKGSLVALLGKNGVGKSTLIKTVAGLLPALDGVIEVNSLKINKLSAIDLSKLVSFVSSEPVFIGHFKVEEVVGLGRFPYKKMFSFENKKDKEIIKNAMQMALVDDLAHCWFDQLSDGQRQRVMIARALAQDTPIILLDEPTSHLDLLNQYEILNVLQNLAYKQYKTILFTSHNLQLALEFCDSIWLMSKDLVKQGCPEDLLIRGDIPLVFDNKRFTIDPLSGAMQFNREYLGKVQVLGNENFNALVDVLINRMHLLKTTDSPEIIVETGQDKNGILFQIKSRSFHKNLGSFAELAAELKNYFLPKDPE